MKLENLRVGLCVTGSFCNFNEIHNVIEDLKKAGVKEIIPIFSFAVNECDTRFYKAKEFREMIEDNTGNKVIDTLVKAEPIGPKNLVDIIMVCPCTGNSLAKIAVGITDTPVLMALKSHIRNNKPVVIAISTNDGLGINLENIAKLLNSKNMYFVPFRQDDYAAKPKSLISDYNLIVDTLYMAVNSEQIQPILARS